jgi:hypothetical protein
MGIFEKRRFRNFLIWVNQFKAEDPNTYQGMRRAQPSPAPLPSPPAAVASCFSVA